ncbi:PilZ domain-containing protein [Novosphingobium sp. RD2P27]|uniref:PilZ domain-containing protein n=1 Tax=Novosphingobium kalidii TaxID=3230299 RepID=A0ABV2D288_9SPHN
MKHEPFDPRSAAELAPRVPRAGITLICEVRQGSRPWAPARLEDLSPGGFRIARLPGARTELPLRIRIPGMQLLSAQIRWTRDAAVGCAFAEPLHVAVFDHIVRNADAA